MVKVVIFDVDNTLYSYTDAHAAAFQALSTYAAEKIGLSQDAFECLYRTTANELKEYMGDVAAQHNHCIRYQVMLERQGLPLYPYVLEMNDLYWSTFLEAAVPSIGVLEAMNELKKEGIRIGVGTDMTARMQFKKLEVLGLLPYIDFLVSSEEAGVEKPEKAFFARCMEKTGVQRQECLLIGDNLKKDVFGAMNAGMKAVWYCPKGNSVRVDVLKIKDMTQLPQMVSAL